MKNTTTLSLILFTSFLLMSCFQSKEKKNNDIDAATTKTHLTTNKKETILQDENYEPPKYETVDLLIKSFLVRFNNSKAPLSEKQIDDIYDLTDGHELTYTFKNQKECGAIKRKLAKTIKTDILTKEQLLLLPGRKNKK